jgi:hypothetical protein
MATNFGYFTQASSGAPTLNGVAGSLITVLDWLYDVSNTNGRKVADKVFSGTNKAVYRHLTGQRPYIRIDDAYGVEARVRLYESMSDVDTGTDEFPLLSTKADTTWIFRKSYEANSNARDWRATVHSRGFLMFVRQALISTAHEMYAIGEAIRGDGVADSTNAFSIMRRNTGTTATDGFMQTSRNYFGGVQANGATQMHACLMRNRAGTVKAPLCCAQAPISANSTWSGISYPTIPYIPAVPVVLNAGDGNNETANQAAEYRGRVPYLYGIFTSTGDAALAEGSTHTGAGGATFVLCKSTDTATFAGNAFLMMTSDSDPEVP